MADTPELGQGGHVALGRHVVRQLEQQPLPCHTLRPELPPETVGNCALELMYSRNRLLRLAEEEPVVFFDEIGITHARGRVIGVEHDLRLRPLDDAPVRAVGLDAAAEPHGIAAAHIAMVVGAGAVVVEPVEELPVCALPREVGRARVLHQPSVRIALVLGLAPRVTAVATVRAGGMAVDGAVDTVERPVTQHRVALFLRDRPAAPRRPQTVLAVRQRLPGDLRGVGLGRDVVALQQHALGPGEEAFTEPANLVQRHVGAAIVDEGLAHVPEVQQFPAVGVAAVDVHEALRDVVPLLRPRAAVVVGILEDEVPERIDTLTPAVTEHARIGLHLAHIVGVVIVEGVDAAAWDFERHGV